MQFDDRWWLEHSPDIFGAASLCLLLNISVTGAYLIYMTLVKRPSSSNEEKEEKGEGHVFDIANLGIGRPSSAPLLTPESGAVILHLQEELSIDALLGSPIVCGLLVRKAWTTALLYWRVAAVRPGIYKITIPHRGSDDCTAEQQGERLAPGETFPPAALLVAALLCLYLRGRTDPLRGGFCRCREVEDGGGNSRLGVGWTEGRLTADGFNDGESGGNIWAASTQKIA